MAQKQSQLIDEVKEHPCLSCGACCASYRVTFPSSETKRTNPFPVPEEYTEDSGIHFKTMKGTGKKHRPSCCALIGKIGVKAICGIYSERPTPCREFMASWENGRPNSRCDEARRLHGMSPLKSSDFVDSQTRKKVG